MFFYDVSLEVGYDITHPTPEFREAYDYHYRKKRRELAFLPAAPGVDTGLNRYLQLTRFHEEMMQRQPELSLELLRQNPFAPMAVDMPRADPKIRRNPDHARGVMEVMMDYPWREIYGLNFTDTMQLQVSEFDRLLHLMIERYPTGRRQKAPESEQ